MHLTAMTLIFGRLAKIPSDSFPYPLFALSGLLPWLYFSGTVSRGTSSLYSNSALITKVYFPRMYLPLSLAISSLVDFGATLLIFFAVAWFGYHRSPTLSVAELMAPLFLLLMTVVALSLWLSALAMKYRDVRQFIGNLIQMMMLVTPVIWPLSLLADRFGNLGASFVYWYSYYPMVGVIEGFRHALLGTPQAPWDLMARGYATATVLGAAYFRSHEREFADVA